MHQQVLLVPAGECSDQEPGSGISLHMGGTMRATNRHFRKALLLLVLAIAPAAAQLTDIITIFSPQGGETYRVGDTMTIRWRFNEGPRLPIGVLPLLSPDGGRTWLWMVSECIETDDPTFYQDSVGTMNFVIPDSLKWSGPGNPNICVIAEQVVININLPYDSDLGDYYTEPFSITPQSTVTERRLTPMNQFPPRVHGAGPWHVDLRGRALRMGATGGACVLRLEWDGARARQLAPF
jgi:hypothetical protein